jgi:hypothetical protein
MNNFFVGGLNIWILIKVLIIILLGMYLIFAFVLTRQAKLMTKTLTLGFEPLAKFLVLAHLIFTIFVFFSAIVLL